MKYSTLRPWLFKLDPETAHDWALRYLSIRSCIPGMDARQAPWYLQPVNTLGMRFPNPLGMAAGFDKNGVCLSGLFSLGFGFVEVGTVTPLPQPGNPKPRLFRLPSAQGLINRLGFNNFGVDALVEKLKNRPSDSGIIGVNIGKNAKTPLESATDDYRICLQKVYPYASYITLNISSPNTLGLRELQHQSYLNTLLLEMKSQQAQLQVQHGYKPILVKIAPDLDSEALQQIVEISLQHQMDGLIATNTTIARPPLSTLEPDYQESGGLSGAPLTTIAIKTLREIRKYAGPTLPLIGVGGILSPEDAKARLDAGATLLQIYTGLIYQGPELISTILKCLRG